MTDCRQQEWENVQPISDLGSGLNYKKKGLTRLHPLDIRKSGRTFDYYPQGQIVEVWKRVGFFLV
jgi:hypothetical protein